MGFLLLHRRMKKPASIMLDLALMQHAPDRDRIQLVQVVVTLNDPNEFGLTNHGEAEILYVMEDQLAEHMAENLGGSYVARSTTNGQRIFYFYCRSAAGFDGVVEEVMEGYSGHTYVATTNQDPYWDFYREFLYPGPGRVSIHPQPPGD